MAVISMPRTVGLVTAVGVIPTGTVRLGDRRACISICGTIGPGPGMRLIPMSGTPVNSVMSRIAVLPSG
jgi:hypothetical protein